MKQQGTAKPNPRPRARPASARPASAGPTLSAGEALAKVTPARRAAFEVLTLVGENKGHSDELLHSPLTESLTPEDRNLATALVMGVLRWQIALDARIRTLLQRPDQRLAAPVAIALRLGAFQLLHMDRIPPHAALSESVELCRAAAQPHATGMVNAILRKIATAQKPGTRVFESTAAFAERLAHPSWLVERWVATYGRESALAICEADQREPEASSLFTEVGGDLPVMDDGSRLVAELAAAAMPDAKTVWESCAAPGGKTLILARRLPHAEIHATDVSAKRTAQMQARFKRFAYAERIQCSVADACSDATAPAKNATTFDLILCDVPCTGTGTLAGNPEIRHRLKPEEFDRQAERQRAILTGALSRLAPGGRLIYSTCSLEPEENEQVVDAVLSTPAFRRVPIDDLLQSLATSGVLREDAALLTPPTEPGAPRLDSETWVSPGQSVSAIRDGALRTLPGIHRCDGFFAVVIERTPST
jgi:16S rRNA (cytosine967-C5)-methyltransferase